MHVSSSSRLQRGDRTARTSPLPRRRQELESCEDPTVECTEGNGGLCRRSKRSWVMTETTDGSSASELLEDKACCISRHRVHGQRKSHVQQRQGARGLQAFTWACVDGPLPRAIGTCLPVCTFLHAASSFYTLVHPCAWPSRPHDLPSHRRSSILVVGAASSA